MQKILSNLQLSWSKVNLFIQCPRCFYREQILGKKRPGIDPDVFSLNKAVDTLWKKEFDEYREKQLPHPIMAAHNIDAVPLKYYLLSDWRNYKAGGIRFFDDSSGIEFFGVVDDIWINSSNELIIVDYKATSKQKRYVAIDITDKWKNSNQLQIEFYASLFRKNGYLVNDTGYLICSFVQDKKAFDQRLDFESYLQPCVINDAWVEVIINDIRSCLEQDKMPPFNENCEFCKFII